MKIIFLIICCCLASCLDVLTDKKFCIRHTVCVIYSNGDGYRLVESIGGNNYSDIIPSTLSELHCAAEGNFDLLILKADPISDKKPYSFYSVKLDSSSAEKYQVKQITQQQYLYAVKSMYKVELSKMR